MSSIRDENLPPQDLDAERSVLCLEMLDPSGYLISVVRNIAPAEDWYSDVNATIQRAIVDLFDREIGVDVMTVKHELERRGQLEEVGGMVELSHIMQTCYQGPHGPFHAQKIADCANRRRIRILADELRKMSSDPTSDQSTLIESALKDVSKMAAKLAEKSRRPKAIKDHILSVAEKIGKGEQPTRFIGIHEIDIALSGIARGENVVIAGITSHGKTMVAMQWLHEAAKNGVSSLFISKEMNGESLGSRLMTGITELKQKDWKESNELLVADINRHYENLAPIIIDESCSSISDIEFAVAKAVEENDIGIVCLDYIQLMRGDGQNREQQVADVSRRWKQLLMKHNLIGLLLSQFNREALKFKKLPSMNDIRDSGAIAQDADIVLIPFWEAKVNPNAEPFLYRILLEKTRQRGAKAPMIEMRIDPEKQWLFACEQRNLEDHFR